MTLVMVVDPDIGIDANLDLVPNRVEKVDVNADLNMNLDTNADLNKHYKHLTCIQELKKR